MVNSTRILVCATLTGALSLSAYAEHKEVVLSDTLDGILNEYCLDIAGGNKNVDITKGLQAHTCYSYKGSLGTDQIFASDRFAENILYMPEYDVCVTLASLEDGAKVGLAACNGSPEQQITFSGTGTIRPVAAPNLCFTAADSTRMGKGSQHQIKALSLAPCSDALAPWQTWGSRTDKS